MDATTNTAPAPKRRRQGPPPPVTVAYVRVEAPPEQVADAERKLIAALASLLDAANDPT